MQLRSSASLPCKNVGMESQWVHIHTSNVNMYHSPSQSDRKRIVLLHSLRFFNPIWPNRWWDRWFVTTPFLPCCAAHTTLCHGGQNADASCDAPCGLVPGKFHADTTFQWPIPWPAPPPLDQKPLVWIQLQRLFIQFRQLIKNDFYNASYLFTWDVFAMKFGNTLWGVPLYFLMLILLEIKHVITPSRLKRVSCKPVWDLTTLKQLE